jgi:hypothetical protein
MEIQFHRKSLWIALKDFLPSILLSDFPPEALKRDIIISFAKLAEYLDIAEVRYQLTSTKQGIPLPELRKWRRASTPPEELALEDEKRFKRVEIEAERAADRKDEDWEA